MSGRSVSFLLVLAALAGTLPASAVETLVISTKRVYPAPNVEPIENAIVVVRKGQITYVGKRESANLPKTAVNSECKGGVLTAGYQNSHVHFIERRWDDAAHKSASELEQSLQDMLTRYGYTTVFDVASDPNTFELRKRIEKRKVPGPRIFTVGLALFPPDGIPSYINDLPPAMLARMHQPRTADEARAAVRSNIAAGADGTKLFLHTSPRQDVVTMMSPEVVRAAVDETHKLGKLVFAHPTSVEALRLAVDAGVDVLVHTTLGDDTPWKPDLVAQMKAAKVSVIPTFKLWHYELAKEEVPPDVVTKLVGDTFKQLKAFRDVKGQVLFGTDVGYMHDYDPADEYQLMRESGMWPREILESLTTAPAALMKEEKEHGQVAKGFAADLVMLGGDPFDNPRNFANVKCTFRGGKVVYSKPNLSKEGS